MSSTDERERWNLKYSQGSHPGLEPDPFLVEAFARFVQPAFPEGGTALDIAGGAGRHAIYLAQSGWQVTQTDISEVAVEQARQNAGALASHIQFLVDDLTHFQASQTQFDLVTGFFFLQREIFPEIVKAVRPGGFLVYKAHTVAQLNLEGGPKSPAHLLAPQELLQMAGGLEVLHFEEKISTGPRAKATAMLVARKP